MQFGNKRKTLMHFMREEHTVACCGTRWCSALCISSEGNLAYSLAAQPSIWRWLLVLWKLADAFLL